MLNAVILAGSEQIKGWHGIENKALININNKAMIEYIIEALKGT